MKICTFASGSSGNCAVVSVGDTNILIDAGISLRRIKNSLEKLGLEPSMLNGIILTHDHSDHTKALKMINKYYALPVFASEGTGNAVCFGLPELRPCLTTFTPGDTFIIGDIEIKSFPTPHDSPESVGYTLKAGGKTLSFATDMGYVTRGIFRAIMGSDTVVIESNHDPDMLKRGPYPYHLKQRILSQKGHLSNHDCGRLAAELIKTGTKRIILAHLSKENNTPRLAYDTVKKAISESGIDEKTEFSLTVAEAGDPGPVYIV